MAGNERDKAKEFAIRFANLLNHFDVDIVAVDVGVYGNAIEIQWNATGEAFRCRSVAPGEDVDGFAEAFALEVSGV